MTPKQIKRKQTELEQLYDEVPNDFIGTVEQIVEIELLLEAESNK